MSTRLRLEWLPLVLAVLCSPPPVRAEPLDVELSGDAATGGPGPKFRISQDGGRVVFQTATEPSDVVSVPIEGGTLATLTPPGTEAPALVDVAPDGSRVLMTARAPGSLTEIFSAPFSGGEVTKLSHPLAPGVSAFAGPITPDSTRVLYRTRAGCSLGTRVFCPPGETELYVAPLGGGSPTPLDQPDLPLDGPLDGRADFSVSPDSEMVVSVMFERLPPDENEDPDPVVLFSTPLAGGPSIVLHEGGWFNEPFQFTGDGQRVVYDRVGELHSASVFGGAAVRLSPDLALPGSPVDFSITPDGSRVVYESDQEQDILEIYSVPTVGGLRTKLSHPDGMFEAFPWQMAPDGERVVFAQWVDSVQALFSAPVQGGTATQLNPPLAPDAPGDFDSIRPIAAIRVSPDGDHVVYAAQQDTDDRWDLYSAPIEGGPVTRLGGPLARGGGPSEDVDSRYRITPDGSRVVFATDSTDSTLDGIFELHAVPIGGGVVTKVSGLMEEGEQIGTFRMEISPDSRHVVFQVSRARSFGTAPELHSARLPPEIRIDIRPRQAHNKLKTGRHVPIAVAILGSGEVDVADVDLATLAFGPSGAAAERKAKRVDVDGDGFLDLVTRYRLHETGIARGDTEACLTGSSDGFEFRSCDAIATGLR